MSLQISSDKIVKLYFTAKAPSDNSSSRVKTFPVGFKGLQRQINFVLFVIKWRRFLKSICSDPGGIAKGIAFAPTCSIFVLLTVWADEYSQFVCL